VKFAMNVHCDNSLAGGKMRLERTLSKEESKRYNQDKYRIRMLTVWRPLVPVVKNAPLAMCDMRSVRDEDLLSVDKINPTHLNQSSYPYYNPTQNWYFLKNQTAEEPLCFLTYDSHAKTQLPGPPHATFEDPTGQSNFIRESIEVRLVAISNAS